MDPTSCIQTSCKTRKLLSHFSSHSLLLHLWSFLAKCNEPHLREIIDFLQSLFDLQTAPEACDAIDHSHHRLLHHLPVDEALQHLRDLQTLLCIPSPELFHLWDTGQRTFLRFHKSIYLLVTVMLGIGHDWQFVELVQQPTNHVVWLVLYLCMHLLYF